MKAECIISVGVFVVIIFVVLVSCCKKKQTVGLDDKHDKERDQFITRNKKTKSITTKGYVQVYSPHCAQKHFVNELIARITSAQRKNESEFKLIEYADDIKPHLPLLVICMHTSRLGTDARKALNGVHDHKASCLLIFNHKNEHTLPSQPSSRLLVGEEFVKLKGIYDLACFTGIGVYECDMNKKSISDIIQFLRSSIIGTGFE